MVCISGVSLALCPCLTVAGLRVHGNLREFGGQVFCKSRVGFKAYTPPFPGSNPRVLSRVPLPP